MHRLLLLPQASFNFGSSRQGTTAYSATVCGGNKKARTV
jgi:hypothetical protein